jgi:hypothetical protein
MGKGSPSQPTQPTSSTVTNTSLPAYIQPYVERNLNRAEGIAQEPYQQYPDQRLATFNPDQNAAFQGVRDIFNQGTDPTMQAAQSSLYGQQARMPFHLGDQWNTQRASEYMNPYQDYVLNNVASRANQQFAMQQGDRNSAAIKAGAFGGDRRFIQDSIAQDNLNRQLTEINASGLNQAYNTGMQGFQNDRNSRLQFEQMNMQGAQGLAGLSNMEQANALNRTNALANVGAGERGLQQQLLDIGYTDFTNQRDFPRQNVSWMSGILHGTPVSPSSEVTRYDVPPNQGSQIAGLGIAGLGAASQAGLFNKSTWS